jgi:hypothetical protein
VRVRASDRSGELDRYAESEAGTLGGALRLELRGAGEPLTSAIDGKV